MRIDDLPVVEWHEKKKALVYPCLASLHDNGCMGPVLVSLVKFKLDMSDEELAAQNLARAPGRNPPIRQTDWVAPPEQEAIYWPFDYQEYLPTIQRTIPTWYVNTWGKHAHE